MNKVVIFLMTISCVILMANGWCSPLKKGGTLNVCKQTGKVNCLGVTSPDACINLVGGPFLSGFTSGNYKCTIYSEAGCGGTSFTCDNAGWSSFKITPKSIKCPCI